MKAAPEEEFGEDAPFRHADRLHDGSAGLTEFRRTHGLQSFLAWGFFARCGWARVDPIRTVHSPHAPARHPLASRKRRRLTRDLPSNVNPCGDGFETRPAL